MVQFATDPGTDVFLRGIDAGERARRARNQVAVDTAIRRGLSQSYGADQTAAPAMAPQAPAAAPQAAPAPAAPAMAPRQAVPPPASPEHAAAREAGFEQPLPPPQAAPAAAPAPPRASVIPTAAPAAPAMAPHASATGDRYDPVLRELAGVEGGGTAALGIMQQQDRTGVLNARRRDQLARLALLAAQKGDHGMAAVFAEQAGIPAPQITAGGRGGAPAIGRLVETEQGLVAVGRDGIARPVLGPDGAPIAGKGKTTGGITEKDWLREAGQIQRAVAADPTIPPHKKQAVIEERLLALKRQFGAAPALVPPLVPAHVERPDDRTPWQKMAPAMFGGKPDPRAPAAAPAPTQPPAAAPAAAPAPAQAAPVGAAPPNVPEGATIRQGTQRYINRGGQLYPVQ